MKTLTLQNTEWTIKKGQSRETGAKPPAFKTKKNKAKTQHNMWWTSLQENKHK